jgi:hypothetical protein
MPRRHFDPRIDAAEPTVKASQRLFSFSCSLCYSLRDITSPRETFKHLPSQASGWVLVRRSKPSRRNFVTIIGPNADRRADAEPMSDYAQEHFRHSRHSLIGNSGRPPRHQGMRMRSGAGGHVSGEDMVRVVVLVLARWDRTLSKPIHRAGRGRRSESGSAETSRGR